MWIEQSDVRDFMRRAGQNCPPRPQLPQKEIAELRARLIEEELHELKDSFADEDLVQVADAVGDLLYVVLGAAVACGIEIEPIFREIHRSNMSKFVDGIRRSDGKWLKGPSYTPANLAPILAQQQEGAECR